MSWKSWVLLFLILAIAAGVVLAIVFWPCSPKQEKEKGNQPSVEMSRGVDHESNMGADHQSNKAAERPSRIDAQMSMEEYRKLQKIGLSDRIGSTTLSLVPERIRDLCGKLNIQRVVVWGHPLHSHTHSYIHQAIVEAFKACNLETHWVPALTDDVNQPLNPTVFSSIPVENTLFITEGQVMSQMPESPQAYYLLHNPRRVLSAGKIDPAKVWNFQFVTPDNSKSSYPVFDAYHRMSLNSAHQEVFAPWATHLLPDQFYPLVDPRNSPNQVVVVGQDGSAYQEKIDRFVQADPSLKLIRKINLGDKEMFQLIRGAKYAPALLNQWQKEHGYIPCRIFKNISAGQVPCTTSLQADYLLHYQTLASNDEADLMRKTKESLQDADGSRIFEKQERAYALVQSRHTYLNRIEFWLTALMQGVAPVAVTSILHMTCHNGCIQYLEQTLHPLTQSLQHLHLLKAHGSTVYNMTSAKADEYWNIYKEEIQKQSHVIVSDTAPLSRIILQHMDEFKGKLLIWVCNAFDYKDNESLQPSDAGFPDAEYYEMIRTVADRYPNQVRIFAYTKLDRIYAIQRSVMWSGPFADLVMKPILAPVLLKPPVPDSLIPEQINAEKSQTFFIPPYSNDQNCIPFEFLREHQLKHYHGRYQGPNDLMGFKAILHIPYAPSNLALFENLARGLVYYIPTLRFLTDLIEHHGGWCREGINMLPFYEWYDPNLKDLFVYFDSWEELVALARSEAHQEKQALCMEYARTHSEQNQKTWAHLLGRW